MSDQVVLGGGGGTGNAEHQGLVVWKGGGGWRRIFHGNGGGTA